MAAVMSQCSRNAGGIRQYGAQQTEIMLFPALPTTKVQCPDGKIKTRSERLANVAQIPTDDRTQEVASAAAFAVTVVSCELTNVLGMTDAQPVANTVLTLLIVVTVVDNFYDALRMGTQLAIRQFGGSGSSSSASTPVDLPLKENLPLGLGYGQWTGSVIRGWSRLSTFNVEREAQCEAAALYAAYVLGLPCFAFRPNALEASALLVAMKNDDDDNSNNNHRGPTSVGVLRMLIWLMAPVAMESMTHAQLIMSDPREAQGFLQRLEDYYSSLSWNKRDDTKMEDVLFWTESSETKADLLQWAFTEADLLLRSNKLILKELSDRLTSGAATIGDCVAVMEGW